MEGVGCSQRWLSPLAREWWWSDTGLCPQKPHFHLNQVLDAKMMDVLCLNHRDEFIYRTTYEIDVCKYNHFRDDLKVFGNNAEEILQVVATCLWAWELWAQLPQHDDWEVPMIDDLTTNEYRDKCKERWKYLIVLVQFWTDNNATVCIRGGPGWPMSALAKLVKDTANCILPSGFWISWKHIVQQTPWYQHRDFCQLLAITPGRPRHHLEDITTSQQDDEVTERPDIGTPVWYILRKITNGNLSTHPPLSSLTWMMTWSHTFTTHWKPLLTRLYRTRAPRLSKKAFRWSQRNLT